MSKKSIGIFVLSCTIAIAAGTFWMVQANESHEADHATCTEAHQDDASKCPHHEGNTAKPDCCKDASKPCPHEHPEGEAKHNEHH